MPDRRIDHKRQSIFSAILPFDEFSPRTGNFRFGGYPTAEAFSTLKV
jgi:hypothetical protein